MQPRAGLGNETGGWRRSGESWREEAILLASAMTLAQMAAENVNMKSKSAMSSAKES